MAIERINRNEQIDITHGGNFFEEAFAEETSARWRESFSATIPNSLYGYPHATCSNGSRDLPFRYFNYNYTAAEPDYVAMCGNSVPAAHAMVLLSEACGVDLYDLMCQGRQLEYQTEAKKTFIRAINSVEDGLYQRLRDLTYSMDDFAKGLNIVEGIIKKPSIIDRVSRVK